MRGRSCFWREGREGGRDVLRLEEEDGGVATRRGMYAWPLLTGGVVVSMFIVSCPFTDLYLSIPTYYSSHTSQKRITLQFHRIGGHKICIFHNFPIPRPSETTTINSPLLHRFISPLHLSPIILMHFTNTSFTNPQHSRSTPSQSILPLITNTPRLLVILRRQPVVLDPVLGRLFLQDV